MEPVYLVAGSRPWNRRVWETKLQKLPGQWHFVAEPHELTLERVRSLKPRYLFFLHWSQIVPCEILEAAECVCFHMTDVPYGRGGSPLQNLIERGDRVTKLTALQMTEELDAGPIYAQEELSLEGNAEEIYLRAAFLSAQMCEKIAREEPEPRAQEGEATVFRRRKPAQSAIPPLESLEKLHDFLRMLDAEGYPHAFLEHHGFRYELRRAALYDGRILADVTITVAPSHEAPGMEEKP